jgi:ACS family hexuronate transporter-like MFS transporter
MVCGLLLLASAINYMDRQTLAGASLRIKNEFHLSPTQYGQIEAMFGYAFAAGSVVFGWAADRFQIRGLYALVLVLWSIAGFATGMAANTDQLLLCRAFLGFFEAGHWPCAIRATRLLLDERQRSMGNGLLQSGASLGAIITPLVLRMLMGDASVPGGWRTPFLVVGAAGLVWIIPWFLLVRSRDLVGNPCGPTAAASTPLIEVLLSRRMLVIFGTIACINTTWQVLRAWLVLFLQEGRGYTESQALYFNSAWFGAADIGCIAAGAIAARLAHRGMGVHASRVWVFAGCSLLCATAAAIPWLSQGAPLLIVLALVAAGALGVFPLYHAFTQDLPGEHQGKITGIAGVAAWIIPAQAQRLFGIVVDRTGSYDLGLALAGLLPLLALFPLWLLWNRNQPPAQPQHPPANPGPPAKGNKGMVTQTRPHPR